MGGTGATGDRHHGAGNGARNIRSGQPDQNKKVKKDKKDKKDQTGQGTTPPP
jgi:hypothetical protein